MAKHFTTVALISLYQRHVLLCRSKNKTAFYMPGGKIEQDETYEQALIREVSEELCLKLTKSDFKQYGSFTAQAYGEHTGTEVTIICYTHLNNLKISSYSNEIAEIKYFSYDEYVHMPETAPAVLLILKSLKEHGLIT